MGFREYLHCRKQSSLGSIGLFLPFIREYGCVYVNLLVRSYGFAHHFLVAKFLLMTACALKMQS